MTGAALIFAPLIVWITKVGVWLAPLSAALIAMLIPGTGLAQADLRRPLPRQRLLQLVLGSYGSLLVAALTFLAFRLSAIGELTHPAILAMIPALIFASVQIRMTRDLRLLPAAQR